MQSHFRSNEEQLRREKQRVAELQSQLTRKEQEFITFRQQNRDLRGQEERLRRGHEQRITELQNQLRRNEQEINTLRQQLIEPQQQETGRHFPDHQREIPHNWVIKETEIQMTTEELGRGAWGAVFKGKFRGCDVAVKEMFDEIYSSYNSHLFEREVDKNAEILVCCSLSEQLLMKGHC